MKGDYHWRTGKRLKLLCNELLCKEGCCSAGWLWLDEPAQSLFTNNGAASLLRVTGKLLLDECKTLVHVGERRRGGRKWRQFCIVPFVKAWTGPCITPNHPVARELLKLEQLTWLSHHPSDCESHDFLIPPGLSTCLSLLLLTLLMAFSSLFACSLSRHPCILLRPFFFIYLSPFWHCSGDSCSLSFLESALVSLQPLLPRLCSIAVSSNLFLTFLLVVSCFMLAPPASEHVSTWTVSLYGSWPCGEGLWFPPPSWVQVKFIERQENTELGGLATPNSTSPWLLWYVHLLCYLACPQPSHILCTILTYILHTYTHTQSDCSV